MYPNYNSNPFTILNFPSRVGNEPSPPPNTYGKECFYPKDMNQSLLDSSSRSNFTRVMNEGGGGRIEALKYKINNNHSGNLTQLLSS